MVFYKTATIYNESIVPAKELICYVSMKKSKTNTII